MSEPISVEDNDESKQQYVSTPLKQYVTMVGEKNSCKWICNFGCKADPYTGSYSRIRAHLIGLLPGQKAQGVALCSKLSKKEREKLKKEEEEAQSFFKGNTRKSSHGSPAAPSLKREEKTSSKHNGELLKLCAREEVDSIVARYFYGSGISFNTARSPFWVDMVRAINEAPKGYKPPSSEKLRTTLLDREKTRIDHSLMPIKQQWATCGVSIVSDGWSNVKNQPLINLLAISGGKAMFLNAVDCARDEKTASYIADILLKAIEDVGRYSVVQVLTDNASSCKLAGDIIQARHPHIFWSGCMAHTLSLLLKDITHSSHPSLSFFGDCYSKAKGVANYIKSHSFVSYIFREFSDLDVIQVKKTKFGNHYVVLDRLYRVKNALRRTVVSEQWESLKNGNSKSRLAHDEVTKVVLDDLFWKSVELILSFTRPIWKMIRFCDSDKAFIGEVYQRMEDMLGSIKEALVNNYEMRMEVEILVLSRWEKINLPLHTLAYVLTPYYYSSHWLASASPGGKKRTKPHADLFVQDVYLQVVDRLVRDSNELPLIRRQLSDFTSNRGVFARPQAIEDRKMMSAVEWWNLYGVAAPELYALAIKVLSQSVNSSCAARPWGTYTFVHSVKRNRLNAGRAESLLYVHYNNRLLSRYRDDYEKSYRNWDNVAYDDNLDNDLESIEEKELSFLYDDEDEVASFLSSEGTQQRGMKSAPSYHAQHGDYTARGKRPRIS